MGSTSIQHKASDIPAQQIFSMYFDGKPPFDTDKSKAEFPDAFVIAALEKWCKQNGNRMYVVSADKAFQRAATATNGILLPVDKLEELLQRLTEAEQPEVRQRAREIFASEEFRESLEEVLVDEIAGVAITYVGDYNNGDPQSIDLIHTDGIRDFTVIGQTSAVLDAIVRARARVNVTIEYEDTSRATYDKEGDAYIGAEISQLEFDDSVVLNVFVRVDIPTKKLISLEMLTSNLFVQEETDFFK